MAHNFLAERARRHVEIVWFLFESMRQNCLSHVAQSFLLPFCETCQRTAMGCFFLRRVTARVLPLSSSSFVETQSLLQRTIVPKCLMHHCSFRAFCCNPFSLFVLGLLFLDSVCTCMCWVHVLVSIKHTDLLGFEAHITYKGFGL